MPIIDRKRFPARLEGALAWSRPFCDLVIRNIAYFSLHTPGRRRLPNGAAAWTEGMQMTDALIPKPPGGGAGGRTRRGGQVIPPGRQTGSRNKATLAAAAFLARESEALTRRAVELALVGDPTAMRLCLERILRPCRERTVKFALPPIESAPRDKARGLKAHDIAAAMKAVTSVLASGAITPGDRCQRFRPAPAGTRRRVQGARCGPHCRVGVAWLNNR